MPASRSARAMIFAPRSCPSRPGLATTTRILFWLSGADMRGRDAPGIVYAPRRQARPDLDPDHDGIALGSAGADRGATQPAPASAQLVHQRGEDAGARGADRMSERDRAAVDVDAVRLDRQHPDRLQ